MAHVGRNFPIKQEWRLYSGEADSLNGFPPATIRFRNQLWVATFTSPPVATWWECEPRPFAFGDFEISYQSEIINTGSPAVRVGATGKVGTDWKMIWKYSVWADDVDQIPWGWHDQLSHFAWWPGDVRTIFTSPPAGGSIYPVGIVELEGKRWPP